MTNKPIANPQSTANSQQLALLKKHFANCFDKHGNFIPAKLQEIVQDSGVALSKEGYSLNWLGKSYARLLANENIRTRLIADTAHNSQPANTASQNLLIKGDNLEVLKHLMGAYSEQVKMIYIDPPYNTGGDGFVYQDDRKFTVEQLSGLAGIDDDEAKRILEFTSSSSNSHSAWLTFMYPRLYLAKQLLRDDGVIFISIDDNEQAQLKVLCDEVFGEENFVAELVWKKKYIGGKHANHFVDLHEYILVFSKRIDLLGEFLIDRPEVQLEKFELEDKHVALRGKYYIRPLKSNLGRRETLIYPIEMPDKTIIKTQWMVAENTLKKLILDDRIVFKEKKDGSYNVYRKYYEKDNGGNVKVPSLIDDVSNADGKSEIKSIFGVNEGREIPFDNPKPIGLLSHLIKPSTNKNDIILDFFAGSGTTAHAVMQLNAEDGGNRQFICVQIDEATDRKGEAYKAGYNTIFDITQARISKAAAKIQVEHPDCKADMGFKLFSTEPMFDKYLDTPEELTANLELFDVMTLSQADRHSLMLTWALRDGIKLGAPLTPVILGGYTAYAVDKILYFVEPAISLDAVVAMLEQLDNNPDFLPSRLVVLGYLLDSKIQREMSEAVKQYNNRKGIELALDIRYN